VLEAGALVNAQFAALINRSSEAAIVVSRVEIVGIVLKGEYMSMDPVVNAYLRVIDMLLRTVASKAVPGHLELLGTISKAHEAEYPEQDTNCLSGHSLDSANVDGLRIVPWH
jgi:hypothetical protein